MSTTKHSPTLTEQDRLALEVRAVINAAAALITRLERPHPKTSRSVRAHRTVPEDHVAKIISLVEQFDVLRQLGTFDVAEARETLQFNHAFRPIADQIAAFLAAVTFTMEARKARVVAAGLRTYQVAKALARDNKNHGLRSALKPLRTEMRRSRRRRKRNPK